MYRMFGGVDLFRKWKEEKSKVVLRGELSAADVNA
jgi:hypothetical protein